MRNCRATHLGPFPDFRNYMTTKRMLLHPRVYVNVRCLIWAVKFVLICRLIACFCTSSRPSTLEFVVTDLQIKTFTVRKSTGVSRIWMFIPEREKSSLSNCNKRCCSFESLALPVCLSVSNLQSRFELMSSQLDVLLAVPQSASLQSTQSSCLSDKHFARVIPPASPHSQVKLKHWAIIHWP